MTCGVLFVCLGNICRSPTAEAVFQEIVQKNGMLPNFDIDSCGTGGGNAEWYKPGGRSYHDGESADSRMKKEAKKRGYILTSKSRSLCREDLHRFDHIICMDEDNVNALMAAARYWGPDFERLAASKVPRFYGVKWSYLCRSRQCASIAS